MAAAAVPNTVLDSLIACGINNVQLFDGQTQAQRVATEVFDDDFESCRLKTSEEIKEDLKTYSSLTIGQGQIRLQPGVRRNLRAFVQWTKDRLRRSEDPAATPFPVINTPDLIRREQVHLKYVQKLCLKYWTGHAMREVS